MACCVIVRQDKTYDNSRKVLLNTSPNAHLSRLTWFAKPLRTHRGRMTGGALRRASNHSKFAVAAPTGLVKCYSVRISEDTNTRVVPTALEGVLSLEEYQARRATVQSPTRLLT